MSSPVFPSGVYNRWDYDPATGKFFRNAETANSSNGASDEAYAPLTDRLTEQPITADNLVVIQVPHEYYSVVPEMVDMLFAGTGIAYAFRDGQVYKVKWSRPAFNSSYL